MEHIASLQDLEKYGILPLTGEADALSFRCLCDLTPRGKKIVSETFSLSGEGFHDAWNSKGVASIMLPYDAWTSIGVIALFDGGCHTVLATEKALYGLDGGEAWHHAEGDYDPETGVFTVTKPAQYTRRFHGELTTMPWPESCCGTIRRQFTFGNGPRQGTRNVHAMSGRAV